MNKLEKTLFEDLTKQAGFYIKDYYSEYLKNNNDLLREENTYLKRKLFGTKSEKNVIS